MTEENALEDSNKDSNSIEVEMKKPTELEEETAGHKSRSSDGITQDNQDDIGVEIDVADGKSSGINTEESAELENTVCEAHEDESRNSLDKTEGSSEPEGNAADALNDSDRIEPEEEQSSNANEIEIENQIDEGNATKLDQRNVLEQDESNSPEQDEIKENISKTEETKKCMTEFDDDSKDKTTSEIKENENVDKLLNSKPSEKVESYSDDEIELDDEISSDSDDSSESSDSSSESDSDSDSESSSDGEETKVSHEDIGDLADDEDEPSNGPIVSKNEVADESAPKLPENYKIPDNAPLELIGEITGLVEKSVIIKANISGEFRVLNESSIFCFEDRTVLGPLFETFGRLQSPMYRVKFDDENEFNKLKQKKGAKVYYVVPDSQFIYTDTIKNLKGTDASNCHDEELPEEEQEFSDDERELAAKQSKKRKKKSKNIKDNSELHDPQPPKQTNNRKRHHGSTNNTESNNSNQNSKYKPYGYPQNNQAQQFNVAPANNVHQHNNPLIHGLPSLQVQQILQLQQQQQQQQQAYVPQVQPNQQQQQPYFPSPQTFQPQLQNQFQGNSLVYGTPYNPQQQHNMLGQNQHPIYNPNQQPPNPYFPQGTPTPYVPNVPQNNFSQWNQSPQQNQLQQLQQLVVNHLNGQTQQQSPASNNLQYPGGNSQFPPQN
ncbi:uncharacterized protein AC631_00295 [Debaryomyces fabryi]|uniref:H/ACA ribonucleoprotein complex non-core subunit NAF1 n=1 Tax=Debaryomyces fabryi TaxID=58627 RepID=A0A0V1Q6G4_9ASCO|nr:uncharacterized protein AC631_00295 [Debaryomyces fabryi]KSA04025.1 hypothetical protein AC631_00295 [Debaryomyces fabryi]CUM53734.1 unnamed protein product [Debaryomyces fabryi]